MYESVDSWLSVPRYRRRTGGCQAGKAKRHVTMGARPSVRMIGEGLATLDLRGSDQGAYARVRNGAWQVLREGTRRLVPIGTSSSSCLQSISPVS